jgi:hypothetical protein
VRKGPRRGDRYATPGAGDDRSGLEPFKNEFVVQSVVVGFSA